MDLVMAECDVCARPAVCDSLLNNSTVETRWRGNPGVTVRLEVRGQGLLCCTLRFCFHLLGSLGESCLFSSSDLFNVFPR